MTDLAVSPRLRLRAAYCTDPGRVRANNEDVPLLDEGRGVYGVIDGIGGHAAGEIAAGLASDVIAQRLARPLGTPAERVREAIAIANNEIFRHADESPELHGMACVVTLALVSDSVLTVGHVGDSRLYLLRGGGMEKLTHDHSPVGEREDAREISEIDAMRHPRRNEIFRDVGSGYRDKDDEEFVEVIEVPFGTECAILVCTDGLTDMLPSAAIERIVRDHAGQPEDVVRTLVAAANEAGGKDNVTVVYAEGPAFAASARRLVAAADEAVAGAFVSAPSVASRSDRRGSFARAILRSRTAWFVAGAIAGVLALLGLIWQLGGVSIGGRTLVVDGTGPGAFALISEAATAARPGDVIRVEPGIYRERIDLPDGVDLIARVPGTVAIARPPSAAGEVVGIAARGDAPARIAGIRIESTPERPLDIGLRISGQGRTVELVEATGPMRAGIDLLPAASLTLRGSHFEVTGPAVTFAEGAHAVVTTCVFVRHGGAGEPPLQVLPSAEVMLRRNVFAGFGTDIAKGLSGESLRQLRMSNILIAEPGR